MQDAQAISRLVDIVASKGGARFVVVSALAKVTDALVELASLCEKGLADQAEVLVEGLSERHQQVGLELQLSREELESIREGFEELKKIVHSLATLKEVTARSKDTILALGELSSSKLVAGAFRQKAHSVVWQDAREVLRTDASFGAALVDMKETENLCQKDLPQILKSSVLVSQGFIASDSKSRTTTLGRGGSDYSAAIFASALGAKNLEIWTDVDGILSTDPRVVPEAKVIPRIHFLEAAEMAYFGAKVLHPATIYPALAQKIPVWILNSKNPEHSGTEITFDMAARSTKVCGMAFKRKVALVNIYSTRMLGAYGFLKSVFDIFARCKLSVDLIATSEVNVSLTLDPNFDSAALDEATALLREFSSVEVHHNRAMVSVVGGGIRNTPGLAAKIFSEVSEFNIQMISMGASELNISFVVDTEQVDAVIQRLHRALIA